ncbi:MAG: tetratricopeptide repeat protein [Candidatus Kryptoniota bacterium]
MNYRYTIKVAFAVFLMTVACYSQQSIKDLQAQVSQSPHDIKALMSLGIAYHSEAVTGNKDAVEKGFECLDTVLALDPTNAMALAYRGSLWTMRGRDAFWPFTKMNDVDKGIDEMDKAVDLAPDNITVRLTRGINSVHLPSMFKRLGTALKDFSYLLKMPAFPHFDAGLQSTIYYWAGVAYKQDNQRDKAKEYLQKAIDAAPGSDNAKNAQQELKDLS